MSAVRRVLGRAFRAYDLLVIRIKAGLHLIGPLEIQVFPGHGTPECVLVRGRLVEATGTREVSEDSSRIRNALNTMRRMESDEIPRARLRVRLNEVAREVRTDDEGFFSVELTPDEPLPPGWHQVEVELLDSIAHGRRARAAGEVMVPATDCEFGVVSDLDDTVVRTDATNRLTHARIMFSRNALTQRPFPGVAEFYRQLQLGPDERGHNPVFYVSRSGWNLFDLFEQFMQKRGLPKGAMYLSDTALVEPKSKRLGHSHHKLESIARIMDIHGDLPLVLIGDSGQKDPEHYREVVRRHPGRIHVIYLRDVTSERRDREVRAVVSDVAEMGVEVVTASETRTLAEHAERAGLIPPGGAARVAQAASSGEPPRQRRPAGHDRGRAGDRGHARPAG